MKMQMENPCLGPKTRGMYTICPRNRALAGATTCRDAGVLCLAHGVCRCWYWCRRTRLSFSHAHRHRRHDRRASRLCEVSIRWLIMFFGGPTGRGGRRGRGTDATQMDLVQHLLEENRPVAIVDRKSGNTGVSRGVFSLG